MPEFDREGGSRRIFHLVQFLQNDGWSVTYLARDGTAGEYYSRTLRQRGVATYAGKESRWVGGEYLADHATLFDRGQFDLAIFAFWYIAEQYLPDLRAISPNTRVVVDSIDLHFLRSARSAIQPHGNRSQVG